ESEDVLSTMRPRLLEMNLGDEDAWEIGLTCGGTIEVFVEPIALDGSPDVGARMYERVREHARRGGHGAIVTRLDGPGGKLLVLDDGTAEGTLGDAFLDERFATKERFPDVDELKVGMPSELIRDYPLVPSTALVLVAHDYKYDLPVLKHALATDVGYLGMLGSSRRGTTILRHLAEDGVTPEALARVHVPIGLDLGARSAPEVALAILAELPAVRGGGSGRLLSRRT